ncbi:MAG: hypothetical protein JWO85_2000 [Candidatus Eremiobacteraeota bacterium]|nr:hypothetical protein [Candidatus Eremiobacteraeota bacterium]
MTFSHRAVLTAGLFVVAGCGGGGGVGTSTLPAQSGLRAPQIAVMSPSPVPTPSPTPLPGKPVGTIYAAVTDRVYALDLAGVGTTTAQRTIIPHPNQTQILEGVATSADGTLDILEDYFPTPSSQSVCRVVVETPTADGPAIAVGTHLCDPVNTGQGEGIARNTVGGYDVLYTDTTLSKDIVHRYGSDGASLVSTLVLDFFPLYLANDRAGHEFLDTSGGRIVLYKGTTQDPTIRNSDVTLVGNPQLGPIAVSPGADRTVYVVEGPLGNQNIYALAPGSNVILRTIGPFTKRYISALAVDSHSNLYAGTDRTDNALYASIQVFDSTANGTPAPTRIIVPSPATNYIRGLAIFE